MIKKDEVSRDPLHLSADAKTNADDKGIWGRPDDKRSIILACYKPPWIHYKLRGRHKLIYLKRF